ncbi:MAG: hypothetical protein FWF33_00465 [Clostridiales bacterium]|nr:hypothetical protein [Clostridiales bacterium]
MIPMLVKYINHKGIEISLSDLPYVIQSENLFDWEWKYDSVGNRDTGAKVTAFYKQLATKNITVAIYAETQNDFLGALDHFSAVIGVDVAENIPGRLMVGADYLRCFITANKKTTWSKGLRVAFYDCTVVVIDGMWTREIHYRFSAAFNENYKHDWGLDYPYGYPYDYTPGKPLHTVEVTSFIPADFVMVIFGPVTNPIITIGMNTYAIGDAARPLELGASEWVTINSRAKSIVKTHANGTMESVLNLRDKSRKFFAPIPPPRHIVSSNAFLDLTIIEHRDEPPWK